MTKQIIDEINVYVGMEANDEPPKENDGNTVPDRQEITSEPVVVETAKPRRQNIPRRRIVERGN